MGLECGHTVRRMVVLHERGWRIESKGEERRSRSSSESLSLLIKELPETSPTVAAATAASATVTETRSTIAADPCLGG